MSPSPQIAVLGPLVAGVDGALSEVRGGRARSLLALLALHPGQVVSVDRCLDEVWGDDLPGNPQNALQARISELRRLLGRSAIAGTGGGYRLDVDADAVDAVRLDTAVQSCRRLLAMGDAAKADAVLADASTLVRGEPLVDVAGGDVIEAERRRLRELVVSSHDLRCQVALATGRHAEIIDELVALVAQHPLQEQLWAHLMVALYRSGRPTDALRAYQDVREILADELGTEPGLSLQRLEQAILDHDPSLAAPAPPATPSATAVQRTGAQRVRRPRTGLIGRHDDLAALRTVVERERLVTLTGPGGAGKTRLAVELAAAEDGVWTDGSVFVDLAAVSDPARVLPTVAQAVGLLDVDQSGDVLAGRVAAHVAGQKLLCVLDNCEHVIEAAADAADVVVGAGPDVRVLATSREPLGLLDEQQWPVPTLALPTDDSPDTIRNSPAVQLFLERARSVRPGNLEDDEALAVVAQIVRDLDGLPLAIELAAARAKVLPVAEIAGRLDERLTLLAGGTRGTRPRQQTLRSLIEWSYELLFDDERRLFRLLGVFAGPFTIDAASAMGRSGGLTESDALAVLERLVDKSMVATVDGPTARFRLLESLRLFALDRLDDAGEASAARRAHLDHFAARALSAEELLRDQDQMVWLRHLDTEADEYRAAHATAVRERDAVAALSLAGGLSRYWWLRNDLAEARDQLRSALALDGDCPPPLRAIGHLWLAWFELDRWDLDEAGHHAELAAATSPDEQAAATVRHLSTIARAMATVGVSPRMLATIRPPDRVRAARHLLEPIRALDTAVHGHWSIALANLVDAVALMAAADFQSAVGAATTSHDHFVAAGDRWGQAKAMQVRSLAWLDLDDLDAADRDLQRGLDLAGSLGNDDTVASLRQQRGLVWLARARPDEAATDFAEAVALGRRLGNAPAVAFPLNGLGTARRRLGDAPAAISAHQEAVALYRSTPLPLGVPYSLLCLAFALVDAGDLPAAANAVTEAWSSPALHDAPEGTAMGLEAAATIAAANGNAAQAARLLGAAAEQRSRPRRAPAVPTGDRTEHDELRARLETVLGAERAEREMTAGAAEERETPSQPGRPLLVG